LRGAWIEICKFGIPATNGGIKHRHIEQYKVSGPAQLAEMKFYKILAGNGVQVARWCIGYCTNSTVIYNTALTAARSRPTAGREFAQQNFAKRA
jgi:hypothetical protein